MPKLLLGIGIRGGGITKFFGGPIKLFIGEGWNKAGGMLVKTR